MSRDISRSATELRSLAAWYRNYAERAGNPMIWASRLTTAEDLEREAAALQQAQSAPE
jgi:hypothetical protein